MEYMPYIIIVILLLYVILNKSLKNKSGNNKKENLPYKINKIFLTKAEHLFYKELEIYINNRVKICPKVGLKDIFFISKNEKNYINYFNKIAKKHVDFLICNKESMQPLCGIELDDSSHTKNAQTHKRDLFVEEVYKNANLPLIRFKVKSSYSNKDFELKLKEIIRNIKETET